MINVKVDKKKRVKDVALLLAWVTSRDMGTR